MVTFAIPPGSVAKLSSRIMKTNPFYAHHRPPLCFVGLPLDILNRMIRIVQIANTMAIIGNDEPP